MLTNFNRWCFIENEHRVKGEFNIKIELKQYAGYDLAWQDDITHVTFFLSPGDMRFVVTSAFTAGMIDGYVACIRMADIPFVDIIFMMNMGDANRGINEYRNIEKQ